MRHLFLPLIFIFSSTQAQYLHPDVPYEKINYLGLKPIWYETSYDPVSVSDSLDGYNQLSPSFDVPELIHEDLIITPYYSRSNYGWNGSLIECRSINNGELKWQQRFTLNEIDHIELIALMYVNADNQLVVISHKERKPYLKFEFQFFFKDMIMTKRVYNLQSGHLLSYFHRDYNDPLGFNTFLTSYPNTSKLYKEGDQLRYIENFIKDDKFCLRSCLLDHTGKRISTIDTMPHDQYSFFYNLVRLHKDTFLHIQMDRNKHLLHFKYLSSELKQYYEVVSDSLPYDPLYIRFEKLSSDQNKLLFTNYFPSNGIPQYNQELLVFDRTGKLLKYGFLPFKIDDFHILEWEDNNSDFTIIDEQNKVLNNTPVSLLRIFKLDINQEIQIIKVFNADNYLRYAVPYSSHKLQNEKYYLRLDERAFKFGINIFFIDDHASAQSQMVVDIENLGLPTNLINYDYKTTVQLKAYPNPTQNESFIDFDSGFTGNISIYNSIGQKMDDFHISNQKQVVLSTNHYQPGIYYILCKDTNSSNKLQLAKLLKVD